MQDYKSVGLRVAVRHMICAAVVNTQTDSFSLVILLARLASV